MVGMTHLKLAELKMFEERKYSEIGMNELIVYTVSLLSENNHTVTREELVLGAFKMFPKKFGWKPKIKLDDGIKRTITWWKDNF